MPGLFPTRAFRRTRERASGLLFAFGIDDTSTVLATGQSLSLTRATGRTVFDSKGRVSTLVHSQWPWSAVYNTTETTWEPTLDVQPGATNLCLRSEDFGTTWTAIGTPTRTAAAVACGDLSLDLIGDDAAGTLEGYSQVITFTTNAVKAISVFLKQGTSTSSVLRLRDTTASANRLLATITWSGGAPSVAMSTGTHVATITCVNGIYRLLFQTSSVTVANTNQLELYPATTSALAVANTGTLYAGGVMAQNAVAPGAYIKTTSATVAVNQDIVSAPVVIPVTQDFTVYLRVARPTWAGLSTGWGGTFPIFGQLGNAGLNYWQLFVDPNNQRVYTLLSLAGTGTNAWQAIPATPTFDICAQFYNVSTGGQSQIDTGAGFSSPSTACGAIPSWTSDTTYISGNATEGAAGVPVRKAIIAPGLRTLAQMRGLNV